MGTSGAEYEIRIRGTIGPDWKDWFDGLRIRSEVTGETVLRGPIRDQSELYGVLCRISDLNLCLISVNRIDDCTTTCPLPPESKE